MSKRRTRDHDDEEEETQKFVSGGLRSLRKLSKSAIASRAIEPDYDPTNKYHQLPESSFEINYFIGILQQLSQESNSSVAIESLKAMLEAAPDRNYNVLHYQNQIIEIPLLGDIILGVNQNFPFRRDPVNISTDFGYFIDNMNHFKNFKKIMLKDCHIQVLSQTYNVHLGSKNVHEPFCPQLIVEVQIFSNSDPSKMLQCTLTEETLRLCNIVLLKPNLWVALVDAINHVTNNKNHVLEAKEKCFFNLVRCFQLLEKVDVAVTLDSSMNVQLTNIFHDYFSL